jgi:hypothetical protein
VRGVAVRVISDPILQQQTRLGQTSSAPHRADHVVVNLTEMGPPPHLVANVAPSPRVPATPALIRLNLDPVPLGMVPKCGSTDQ